MNIEEKWKFSQIPNIEESNFNKILERFYGLGVKGLTKENIQNSLDGRLPDDKEPVIVKVNTGTLSKNDIPGIENVIERIKSLDGKNSYTKETINHMLQKIYQEEIRYISFEDINTRGLTGAKNGQSYLKEDTWGVYAYNKGVHFEENDKTIETSRGGSHGVGKIASNAASDIHVMYFANCDAYGNQHLGGTVQLIEHRFNDQYYRSTGYFTDEVIENGNLKFYPYENKFNPVFEKATRGLKIIIPYLREEFDSEEDIIKTVCDSFFVSILDNRLEVYINDHIINKDTIMTYLNNNMYYVQDTSEMKKDFTPLYARTYLNEEPRIISVSNRDRDYEFKLFFKYDESITKGRVAIVRTIGMKIEDFSVKSNATKPFNAVLIGGVEEDGYLKSLENESHTKISAEDIKDKKLKLDATRFISNLSKEIANVIDEEMKRNNRTDGEMDTSDLLYTMDTSFKRELAEALGAVKTNKGNPLVKSADVIPKDGKRNERKNKITNEPKDTGIKRKPSKKDENTSKELEEIGSDIYSVSPHLVERLLVRGKEIIQIDFRNIKGLKSANMCNLLFSVVDGMGLEYDNEFNLLDNYLKITDLNRDSERSFDNKSIKRVSINKGMIRLELSLKESYNRALKFIYYVEV